MNIFWILIPIRPVCTHVYPRTPASATIRKCAVRRVDSRDTITDSHKGGLACSSAVHSRQLRAVHVDQLRINARCCWTARWSALLLGAREVRGAGGHQFAHTCCRCKACSPTITDWSRGPRAMCCTCSSAHTSGFTEQWNGCGSNPQRVCSMVTPVPCHTPRTRFLTMCKHARSFSASECSCASQCPVAAMRSSSVSLWWAGSVTFRSDGELLLAPVVLRSARTMPP
eukprot:3913367-Prymnesium_polylepis.1